MRRQKLNDHRVAPFANHREVANLTLVTNVNPNRRNYHRVLRPGGNHES